MTQRRMRPQISRLIRPTYDDLIDHPHVLTYPDVTCFQNNILFFSHTAPEDKKKEGVSCKNVFEADMVVAIARYFLQVGYKPDQLVILTPYLGQLMEIQLKVRKEIADVVALLGEMDKAELVNEGLLIDDCDDSSTKSFKMRCSTVDNFQGEESDIVIISLVRSNTEGVIGFLKEPERVNVLLSRAKHGMFILGNSTTLLESKSGSKVWKPILDNLAAEGCIVDSFISTCPLHPEDTVQLKTPQDFSLLRPNGGCICPCHFRMKCGHACPSLCHPLDQAHELTKCFKPCPRFAAECPLEHRCPLLCWETCRKCEIFLPLVPLLDCGHLTDSRCKDVVDGVCQLVCKKEGISITIPGCGHTCKVSCVQSRKPTTDWVCSQKVEASLGCGHKNTVTCGGRNSSGDIQNLKCDIKCDNILFCGHQCGLKCHFGVACSPCKLKCTRKCVHSTCPLLCHDVCNSCIDPCEWNCEHQGKCDLPCGAPCTRLPSNLRCDKLLECKHRCPSICGELCPDKRFCQECGTDNKTKVVDLVQGITFEDCNLDDDPICVLPCGHMFCVSTLDGLMEMSNYYSSDSHGNWKAVLPLSAPMPKTCPLCREIVHSINRYGRAIKASDIKVLDRLYILYCERTCKEVAASTKLSFSGKVLALRTLFKDTIKNSPIRKLYYASGGNKQIEVPAPSSICLLQIATAFLESALLYIKVNNGGSESLNRTEEKDELPQKSAKLSRVLKSLTSNKRNNFILDAIQIGGVAGYSKRVAEVKLKFVRLCINYADKSLITEVKNRGDRKDAEKMHAILVQMMKDVSDSSPTSSVSEQSRSDAKGLLSILSQSITPEEIKSVMKAMGSVIGNDLINFGASSSRHWYECPNSHPYFIGECGGAMESARCPECGEKVGGGSHTLTAGNREAVDRMLARMQSGGGGGGARGGAQGGGEGDGGEV